MEENKPVQNINELIDEDTIQKLGDASIQRINRIRSMVKEYFRALNGSINSLEMYQIGVDTMLAGAQLVSRSMDMDELSIEQRITMMNATLNVFINVLNKVYLDPNVVAGQVAKAALESAQRKGVLKNA